MKRACSTLFILGALAAVAFAQESNPQLTSMQETFADATPEVKLRLLNNVTGRENASDFGPLYGQALEFLVGDASAVDSSSTYQGIMRTAIQGAVTANHSAALDSLWALFRSVRTTELRVQVLSASAEIGADDEEATAVLNQWVQGRHDEFENGTNLNIQLMEAAIRAMGTVGDNLFFPTLIDAAVLQYDEQVVNAAREAIAALDGPLGELARQDFPERSPQELRNALAFLLSSEQLSQADKNELARVAMVQALSTSTRNVEQDAERRRVRYLALETITENAYGEATGAVVEHFNQTVREYDEKRVQKARLIDAIDGLGAMGTEEAAQRLSRYLELLNTLTENDRPTDTQITLTVVENLGELGFEVAYNSLFYASLLDYPTRIDNAIENALTAISQ